MASVAVVWRDPFALCQQLQSLPGAVPYANTLTSALYVSADGNTIVGWAADASGNRQPVKWVGTSVVPLTPVATAAQASFCSPDASIILGDDGTGTALVRWTSGGTAGVLLAPASGQTGTKGPRYGGRPFSDDGGTVVANSTNSGHGVATRWAGVTPTGLPSVTGDGAAAGCSQDGSIVVGHDDNGAIKKACYWTGTTCRVLVKDPTATVLFYDALFCNGGGSVIWGTAGNDISGAALTRPCFWDSLSTVTGGLYGAQHFLAGLTPITGNNFTVPTITWMAETGSNVVVGYGASTPAGAFRGIRWSGTVPTDLGALPGAGAALANGCSATGARVCGYGDDGSGGNWALYWDDANTLHKLPTLPNALPGFEGRATGMSRDGSTIFGTVDIGEGGGGGNGGGGTPEPAALSENLISLSVSYDRGHSFGSPVSQPMGKPGEYRKSLLWRRLGMGRDAVFKLEWSSPRPTALQGCWLEADIGDGGQEKK